jgi:hypothetical protein
MEYRDIDQLNAMHKQTDRPEHTREDAFILGYKYAQALYEHQIKNAKADLISSLKHLSTAP